LGYSCSVGAEKAGNHRIKLDNYGLDEIANPTLPQRIKSVQNIKKVKQDVLNKAASMYPNVFLSKKNTGHREVRLVLAS